MREFRSKALGNINNDAFENIQKCHDWRNHVPNEVADVWEHLSQLERALVADHAASAESGINAAMLLSCAHRGGC